MKLNIKKTEKTFVNLINASNKNDSSRFDACCYIIEIVVRFGLTSKELESHLVTALDNVTKGQHYDCLNYNTLKRLKSLCCNKNMIKQIKKDNPKSVKSFLANYNIDTQNLLQTACYSNGIFSNDEVKEKDTKKLHTKKRLDAQKRKAQGKTDQQKASNKKVNFNTKNIEKNIQNALLTLKSVMDNPALSNHAQVTRNMLECLLNKDTELFNIHFDNYAKNGTKAK